MNRAQRAALLFTVLATHTACGFDSEDSHKSFKYRMNSNGCDTGEHSFSSQRAYCHALLDDSLNQFCARGMREARYEEEKCGS